MDSPETQAIFERINDNANLARERAERESRRQERERAKREKQQRKKDIIKKAIITISLIATLTSTVAITKHITNEVTDFNNAIVSSREERQDINEKINEYTALMRNYDDPENSIETYLGRIEINGKDEAKVDYTYQNINNLRKHLLNAANISETEVRCVIISAFNIINETYQNDVINQALRGLQEKQDEKAVYRLPANTQELLESLGYENWEEYRMNERNNIIDFEAIANHIGGRRS